MFCNTSSQAVKQGKQKKIANQLFAGWSFNTDKHDIHTATIIKFLKPFH